MGHRWYEDGKGNRSSLRLIVVPAAYIGMATVIAGVVAMFHDLSAAGTAMTVGAGMAAVSEGAKAWQAQSENQSGSG